MNSYQFFNGNAAFTSQDEVKPQFLMQRTDSGYGSSNGREYISPSELLSPATSINDVMDWSPKEEEQLPGYGYTDEELVAYTNYTARSSFDTGYGDTGYNALEMNYDYGYGQTQSSNNWLPATSPVSSVSQGSQGGQRYSSNNWTSGVSHVEQSSSSSSQAAKEYQCMHENCTQKPFKRSADLDRHLKQVHFKDRQAETYSCDYQRCSRADRHDASVAFHRKDHFRDHLREFHKEDMLKRGNKDNAAWLKDRRMILSWWRCSKCLARIPLEGAGAGAGANKWECPECRVSIESARKKEREHRQREENAQVAAGQAGYR